MFNIYIYFLKFYYVILKAVYAHINTNLHNTYVYVQFNKLCNIIESVATDEYKRKKKSNDHSFTCSAEVSQN